MEYLRAQDSVEVSFDDTIVKLFGSREVEKPQYICSVLRGERCRVN
jgi:hypothetical protein